MFTSVDAITAQSRGANSYLGETSFMALILRQQGRQTFGLGFLAMAGSMVGVKLNSKSDPFSTATDQQEDEDS